MIDLLFNVFWLTVNPLFDHQVVNHDVSLCFLFDIT